MNWITYAILAASSFGLYNFFFENGGREIQLNGGGNACDWDGFLGGNDLDNHPESFWTKFEF